MDTHAWGERELDQLRQLVCDTGIGEWEKKSEEWFSMSGHERSAKSLMGKYYKHIYVRAANKAVPVPTEIRTVVPAAPVPPRATKRRAQAVDDGTATPDAASLDPDADFEILWSSLEHLGWTRENGSRQRKDYFFMPPGVQPCAPWRSRVDYFDSIKGLREFLKNGCKPGSAGREQRSRKPPRKRQATSSKHDPISNRGLGRLGSGSVT